MNDKCPTCNVSREDRPDLFFDEHEKCADCEADEKETLQKHAKTALQIQDACNLSGVVHEFSRVMSFLCDRGLCTDDRNKHPIAVLFADKIAHLTGTQCFCQSNAAAYDAVYKLADGK